MNKKTTDRAKSQGKEDTGEALRFCSCYAQSKDSKSPTGMTETNDGLKETNEDTIYLQFQEGCLEKLRQIDEEVKELIKKLPKSLAITVNRFLDSDRFLDHALNLEMISSPTDLTITYIISASECYLELISAIKTGDYAIIKPSLDLFGAGHTPSKFEVDLRNLTKQNMKDKNKEIHKKLLQDVDKKLQSETEKTGMTLTNDIKKVKMDEKKEFNIFREGYIEESNKYREWRKEKIPEEFETTEFIVLAMDNLISHCAYPELYIKWVEVYNHIVKKHNLTLMEKPIN